MAASGDVGNDMGMQQAAKQLRTPRRPLPMIACTKEAGFDEFAPAREQFEKLMGELLLRLELTRTLEHMGRLSR